jgi:CheY-like chemotaxis protein
MEPHSGWHSGGYVASMTTTAIPLTSSKNTAAPLGKSAATGTRKRLLIADDLRSLRESLQRLLTLAGYDVTLAANGREAMEQITREWFDVVLLDLTMPELDGWEALKRIKALRPSLPVIVMTAHPHQQDWVKPSGAAALFEKPLEIEVLLSTIARLTSSGPPPGASDFSHCPPRPRNASGMFSRSGLNDE